MNDKGFTETFRSLSGVEFKQALTDYLSTATTAFKSYDELLNKILQKVNVYKKNINCKELSLKDYLIFKNCNLLDTSKSTIAFRNTLAITFPKEFIAHMFLCLINYRINL